MTKIEQNALRIAELYRTFMYDGLIKPQSMSYSMDEINKTVEQYSSYDGLMSIVESEISDYELKAVHFELEGCGLLEAVQKYVIKYLEQKNGK